MSMRNISKEDLTKYQLRHKCPPMEAYRSLFSQKLLDLLEPKIGQDGVSSPPSRDDVITVIRELIFQVIGEGIKK